MQVIPRFGARLSLLGGALVGSTACVLFGLLEDVSTATQLISLALVMKSVEAIGSACAVISAATLLVHTFPNSFGIFIVSNPAFYDLP